MKLGRRMFLKTAGGAAVALPVLESLMPEEASAAGEGVEPFAIFLRQANGVAAEQNTNEIGSEPERFWPASLGALTPENVQGRSLEELGDHLSRLLVVRNINMANFNYADGHARGALQGLTAAAPAVPGQGGASEAGGESIDHRIGRELNPDGRDSLFLYAGRNSGWLGGACISYRGSANRRAPIHNPLTAYQTMMGLDQDQFEELAARQQSINDLVRDQMDSLMASPRLGEDDRRRLDLHMQSIRELESSLACTMTEDELAVLEGQSASYDSDDGDAVMAAVRAHMDVAALAVACGYTRSVAIQVGSGNDGSTRYRHLETGALMENFHYISHRRLSHGNDGSVIPDSDVLHAMVDRTFARAFKYLLDRLYAYELPDGRRLVDCGVALWYNDNGNGPAHSNRNIPTIIGGSAGGFLRQGEVIEASSGSNEANHARLLNTIGTAAGLRKGNGEPIDDFGDSSLDRSILTELLA